MQKLSLAVICLLACAFSFSSCKKYDDEWIKIKSDDFEKRIAALETWQATANAEIISLQNLIKSINENDFVTKVTPLEDGTGYVISFKKGGDITIKHGENGAQGDKGDKGDKGEQGEKGDMPVIGTKQDTDGIYYWTIGGEWILDGDKKMPVTGEKGADAIAPRIRIDEDTLEWEISTDGGVTYTPTGIVAKGDKGDSMFSALDNTNEKYVELTLADGETKIQLPRYAEFAISFEIPENEIFYASPANNKITLVLPSTLREEDYRSIIAAVTPAKDENAFVKSGSDWNVEITAPVFDENGNVVEGSAKLAVTGCSDSRLSDTYMLHVALVSTDGKEATATCIIKYFDGVIAESTEDITDNNVARLAWKGEITEEDLLYMKVHLSSSMQLLDLSAAETTELPRYALYKMTALKEVVLPEGLTTIGNSAFAMCAALEKVNFPSTVTTLGSFMFEECKRLRSINIPEGVASLPANAFYHATGLKSIVLPETVEIIDQYAFVCCISLEEVVMSSKIRQIGSGAFYGCKLLKAITIPTGVEVIKGGTFNGCESLQYVYWHDGIKDIGDYAFYGCASLSAPLTESPQDDNTLFLPTSLQEVGGFAFSKCNKIHHVNMKDTQVKVIQAGAFYNCPNLVEVIFSDILRQIDGNAFDSTNLSKIELPASLQYVGPEAFASVPLVEVKCHAKNAPALGTYLAKPDNPATFSDFVKNNGTLVIPKRSRSSYENSRNDWTRFFKNVDASIK